MSKEITLLGVVSGCIGMTNQVLEYLSDREDADIAKAIANQERQIANRERLIASQERIAKQEAEALANQERIAKEISEQKAQRLADKLKALGINPDEV